MSGKETPFPCRDRQIKQMGEKVLITALYFHAVENDPTLFFLFSCFYADIMLGTPTSSTGAP